MSQTEQAPDPSMEDILASIRRIISDDDRSGVENIVVEKQAFKPFSVVPNPSQEEDVVEEVFDLTDEFVFAEIPSAKAVSTAETVMQSELVEEEVVKEPQVQETEAVSQTAETQLTAPEPIDAPIQVAHPAEPEVLVYETDVEEEAVEPAPLPKRPPATKPVWSRREMPTFNNVPEMPMTQNSGTQSTTTASAEAPTSLRRWTPPPSTSSRSWAEDIKMPVPEHGPVSLVGLPFDQSANNTPRNTFATPSANRTSVSHKTEALAEATESLAKSIAHNLRDEELIDASRVDFEHIDMQAKTDVAEKIADAIHLPQTNEAKRPYVERNFLDDMLAQKFPRHYPSQDESDTLPEPEIETTSKSNFTYKPYQPTPHLPSNIAVSPLETELSIDRTLSENAASSAINFVKPHLPQEKPQEKNKQVAPFNTIQPSQAVSQISMSSSGSLEDTVRDMLRPMLVQWLNENMQRILEDAIRAEISSRGLLNGDKPKSS